MSKNIEFIQLNNPQEMMVAYPLVKQMYQDVSKESYYVHIQEMHKLNNFKMVAALLDKEIVAVSGYWILIMLYCGRYIQVSNLVVDEKMRGQGIGKKLLRHLEKIGREMNCEKFILDSYTENKKSHKLYFSENFYIRGLHFMKDL